MIHLFKQLSSYLNLKAYELCGAMILLFALTALLLVYNDEGKDYKIIVVTNSYNPESTIYNTNDYKLTDSSVIFNHGVVFQDVIEIHNYNHYVIASKDFGLLHINK